MNLTRVPLPPETRNPLIRQTYDIIGCLHEVRKDLGPGMPEYIYQEALYICLQEHGFAPQKEYQHHPIFHGKVLDSYLKMDLMVPMESGNVVIECKAITDLGDRERYQLYGYLRGTEFPIGLLVNFGSNPQAQIERYYFDRSTSTIRAF